MTSLSLSVRGPQAMLRVNTTTMIVDINSGFGSLVKNGVGDVSLSFDSLSLLNIQGEAIVSLALASTVYRVAVFDALPSLTGGIRVRIFDQAGAPADSFLCVAVFRT